MYSKIIAYSLAILLIVNCAKQNESDGEKSGSPKVFEKVESADTADIIKTLLNNIQQDKNDTRFVDFSPAFPLWTDGLDKKRGIYIPSDKKIDDSNINDWIFPKGTIAYKNFSAEKKLIETRVFVKINEGAGFDQWEALVYQWSSDRKKFTELKEGATIPHPLSNESEYQIPSETMCESCHVGTKDVLLGFSGLQLTKPNETFNAKMPLSVEQLYKDKKFTTDSYSSVKHKFETPKNTSEESLEILGYLHSNCGHCHNESNTAPAAFTGFFTRHTDPMLDYRLEPVYSTGVAKNLFIKQSETYPLHSIMAGRMPPIGVAIKDKATTDKVEAWLSKFDLEDYKAIDPNQKVIVLIEASEFGTISVDGTKLDCGSTGICEQQEKILKSLSLVASPFEGYEINSWSDESCGSSSTCEIVLKGNTKIRVNISKKAVDDPMNTPDLCLMDVKGTCQSNPKLSNYSGIDFAGVNNLSAGTNEDACAYRAIQVFRYCGFGSEVITTFTNSGNKYFGPTKKGPNQCRIQIFGNCDESSMSNFIGLDAFGMANLDTGTNKVNCERRAQQLHNFCKQIPEKVTAEFTNENIKFEYPNN